MRSAAVRIMTSPVPPRPLCVAFTMAVSTGYSPEPASDEVAACRERRDRDHDRDQIRGMKRSDQFGPGRQRNRHRKQQRIGDGNHKEAEDEPRALFEARAE